MVGFIDEMYTWNFQVRCNCSHLMFSFMIRLLTSLPERHRGVGDGVECSVVKSTWSSCRGYRFSFSIQNRASTVLACSFRGKSYPLFWVPQAPGMHMVYKHPSRQKLIHIIQISSYIHTKWISKENTHTGGFQLLGEEAWVDGENMWKQGYIKTYTLKDVRLGGAYGQHRITTWPFSHSLLTVIPFAYTLVFYH